jgi:hypothetical protein
MGLLLLIHNQKGAGESANTLYDTMFLVDM